MKLTTSTHNIIKLSDTDLQYIKDGMYFYHVKLCKDIKLIEKYAGGDSLMYKDIIELTMKIETICQELGIPGYEFT